jgi:hypothetical protein
MLLIPAGIAFCESFKLAIPDKVGVAIRYFSRLGWIMTALMKSEY